MINLVEANILRIGFSDIYGVPNVSQWLMVKMVQKISQNGRVTNHNGYWCCVDNISKEYVKHERFRKKIKSLRKFEKSYPDLAGRIEDDMYLYALSEFP